MKKRKKKAENPLGRIVQMVVVNKVLHALTSTGGVYAYVAEALDDGSDGWEPLTELTEANLVPPDDEDDPEEDDEGDEDDGS